MPRIRPQVSLVLDKDDTKGITTPGIVEGYEWQADGKTRKRYQTLVAYSAGTIAWLKTPPQGGK
jgi:hypothetical protein